MIFGIGTDIVAIERVQRALTRHGERFAKRILADSEWPGFVASQQQAHYLAKRFAAKEAAAKAMGTGFRDGISLRHIAVEHDALGKPTLVFDANLSARHSDMGIGEAHLSLSDEKHYALAFVTLMRRT